MISLTVMDTSVNLQFWATVAAVLIATYYLLGRALSANMLQALPNMPSAALPSQDLAGVEKVALSKLDDLVARREGKVALVQGTEARIFWAGDGSKRKQTEWALCCIHGWSGSREENAPTINRLAEALEANMYCGRLSGHGRGGTVGQELLDEANPQQLFQDAVDMLHVALRLGKKVCGDAHSRGRRRGGGGRRHRRRRRYR